jgi:ABC-type bacteriocin/lantibiotic exporter with double-glycine peptidase domain
VIPRISKRSFARIALLILAGVLGGGIYCGQIASHNLDFRKRLRFAFTGEEYLGARGVTLQKNSNDCGVAALHMILARFGRTESFEQLQYELPLRHTGTSMGDLKRVAEHHGLPAAGWFYVPSDLRSIPLPAIAFINRNHFVVMDSFDTRGSIILLDPAVGRLRVSQSRFLRMWKGETLIFGGQTKS